VAAYIRRSVMNNSASSTVIIGFSKTKLIVSKLGGLLLVGVCYVALFGSRLSQGMRSWLCDVLGQLV
jgi:hypothetical protein